MIMPSWNEVLLELESYMERYRNALEEIASSGNQMNPEHLKNIARIALDGEPTTADEFNFSAHDPGDEDKNARKSKVTHVDLWDKERKGFDVVSTQEEE
jgi:hypothetical protein